MKFSRRKFLGTCAGGAVVGTIRPQNLFVEEVKPGHLPEPDFSEGVSLKSALQNRKANSTVGL